MVKMLWIQHLDPILRPEHFKIGIPAGGPTLVTNDMDLFAVEIPHLLVGLLQWFLWASTEAFKPNYASWKNQNSNGSFATPFNAHPFVPRTFCRWKFHVLTLGQPDVRHFPSKTQCSWTCRRGIHRPSCKHLNHFRFATRSRNDTFACWNPRSAHFPERFMGFCEKMMLLASTWTIHHAPVDITHTPRIPSETSHHSPDLSGKNPSAHDFIRLIQIKGRRLIGTIGCPIFPGTSWDRAKQRNGRNVGNQPLRGSLV